MGSIQESQFLVSIWKALTQPFQVFLFLCCFRDGGRAPYPHGGGGGGGRGWWWLVPRVVTEYMLLEKTLRSTVVVSGVLCTRHKIKNIGVLS